MGNYLNIVSIEENEYFFCIEILLLMHNLLRRNTTIKYKEEYDILSKPWNL